MTDYNGKFTVGDGLPAWVIPIVAQDGTFVVDNSPYPGYHKDNTDETGVDDAFAALQASGAIATRAALVDLLQDIHDSCDGDPGVITIRQHGDAVMIFCPRDMRDRMSIETWQRIAARYRRIVRSPAEEAQRAQAKRQAMEKQRHSDELVRATHQLAGMIRIFGREALERNLFDLRMYAQARGCYDVSLLLDKEPGLFVPLYERAKLRNMTRLELLKLAKAHRIPGTSTMKKFELIVALDQFYPLEAPCSTATPSAAHQPACGQ